MHNISQLNSLCNTPDGILSNKEGILWRRSYFEEAQKEACNYAKNVLCHRHFSRNLVKIYRKAMLTNFFWCMRSKIQQSTHTVMFSNPLMLVVTKGHTYLESHSSHQLCSVKKLFREKAVSENFQEVPRKSFTPQCILKAQSYTEYELCH